MNKLLWVWILLFNLNVFANQGGPLLSNFRIVKGKNNKVYFDSSKALKGSNYTGFTISGKKISGIRISSGNTTGHYLIVSSAFNFWNNNTIRYKGGSNLKSRDGSPLDPFTLKAIINNISEPSYKGKVYYVSTRGNNKNSGTSISKSWKTITYAATKAIAGDIVYIKAGNYGREYIVLRKSGTSTKPIKFIGYKNNPGDINKMYYKHGDGSLKAVEMPLINGSINTKNGISLMGTKYCIIKNIQITKYGKGIDANSSSGFNVFENLLINDIGRSNNGFGIILNNLNGSNRILNTTVINVSNSLVRVFGDNNLIDNFTGTCDRGTTTGPATDYYISIYKGSNNIVSNSYIRRVGNLGHTGHGISLKGSGRKTQYNLITDCRVDNIAQGVELRHNEVKYNVVRNVIFTGNKSHRAGGLSIRDNSSNNTIESCTMKGLYQGIRFTDNSGEQGRQAGGHYNKIINSVFNGCATNIVIKGIDGAALPSKNNEFINCTFYNSPFMFLVKEKFDKSNKLTNCNLVKVNKLESRRSGKLSITQTYNNYYNSFSKPSGIGNIKNDPKFVNASAGNFKLKSNSPLINKGKSMKDLGYDFMYNPRPVGSSHDIGAFEYQESGETTVVPDEPTTAPSESENCTGVVTAKLGRDITINKGEKIILTASGGDAYLWKNGATSTSITVSPIKDTYYRVTAYKDGCQDDDTIKVNVIITSSKTGTVKGTQESTNINLKEEDIIEQKLLIYPNPTSGKVNLVLMNVTNDFNIVITDYRGRTVYLDRMKLNYDNRISKQFDLSRLPVGLYFIRLFNHDSNITKKILIN